MNLDEALKKYFGYDAIRPLQKEIINDALAGRDVFALIPTGGGQSIFFECIQLLAPPSLQTTLADLGEAPRRIKARPCRNVFGCGNRAQTFEQFPAPNNRSADSRSYHVLIAGRRLR